MSGAHGGVHNDWWSMQAEEGVRWAFPALPVPGVFSRPGVSQARGHIREPGRRDLPHGSPGVGERDAEPLISDKP